MLAKRSAFTEEELSQASKYIQTYPIMVGQYLPDRSQDNPFSRLIASNDPFTFARQYKFNVSAVYNNAPFFFFTLKFDQLVNRSVDQGIDWSVNLGVAVLAIALLLSFVAMLGFLIVPLALATGWQQQKLLPLVYFVARSGWATSWWKSRLFSASSCF